MDRRDKQRDYVREGAWEQRTEEEEDHERLDRDSFSIDSLGHYKW